MIASCEDVVLHHPASVKRRCGISFGGKIVNVQEFVTESLRQIIDGVSDAQSYANEKQAHINPPSYYMNLATGKPERDDRVRNQSVGQMVDFDIAVIVTSTAANKDTIRVVGGPLGLDVEAGQHEHSTASRIRFSVPLFLPQQK